MKNNLQNGDNLSLLVFIELGFTILQEVYILYTSRSTCSKNIIVSISVTYPENNFGCAKQEP